MSDAGRPQPEAQAFEAPTEQHQMLKQAEGVWDVDCKYLIDPANPMSAKGTETVELVGPFWACSRFETMMGDMPYSGRATIGYDTREKCWVSTWIGCTDPHLWTFKGERDENEKTLTMSGKGPMPGSSGLADYVTVEREISPDEKTFEMILLPPGGDPVTLFEYRYTRRKSFALRS